MSKMYIDDVRDPSDDSWIVVRTWKQAVDWMNENGCPQHISFDHDLGENSLSGYDVAKFMVERDTDEIGYFIPSDFSYQVHSANPVGAKNICGLLDNWLEIKEIRGYER